MSQTAPTKMFKVRINLPGFGPKIVTSLISDLTLANGNLTDLSGLPCYFYGPGAPSASTLLSGKANAQYVLNDLYGDITGNALYQCTTAGSKSTSQWKQISGGGGGFTNYNSSLSYSPGQAVYQAGVGSFWAKIAVPAGQAPAYPENIYWKLIAFDVQQGSVCGTGSQSVYVNASGPF